MDLVTARLQAAYDSRKTALVEAAVAAGSNSSSSDDSSSNSDKGEKVRVAAAQGG